MASVTAATIIRTGLVLVGQWALGKLQDALDSAGALGGKNRESVVRRIEGQKVNVRSTQASLPVVYGIQRVGLVVNDVRNAASPGTFFSGATGKDVLVKSGAIAIGSEDGSGIQAVDNIRVYDDGDYAITSPASFPSSAVNTNVATPYTNYLKYIIQDGDDAQALPSDLGTAMGWSADYKARGIAYAAFFCLYNENVWKRGVPQITMDVTGNRVYDPRTSSWIGYNASGASSDNPALCILDYLTSKRYGAGIPYAARDGGTLDFIDEQSFEDAADYCDVLVNTYTAGPQEKRFRMNAVVDTSRVVSANLVEMLATCRGELVWQNGKYRLIIRQAQTAQSFELTEDNIVGSLDWTRQGTSVPNLIEATFPNGSGDDYVADSIQFPPVGTTTYLDEDNGIENRLEIALPYTTSIYQAQRTVETMLKELRADVYVTLTATQAAYTLQVGDVVNVTHSGPQWSQKPFVVRSVALTADGLVGLGLQEYDSTAYTLTTPDQESSDDAIDLPDPQRAFITIGMSGDRFVSQGATTSGGVAAQQWKRRLQFRTGINTRSVNIVYDFDRPGLAGGAATNFSRNYVLNVTPDTEVTHILQDGASADQIFLARDDNGTTRYDEAISVTITPNDTTGGGGQDGTVVTTQILDLALEDDLGFRVDAEVEVVEANYAEANGDAWFSFTTSIAYFAQGFTMPAGTDRDLASVEVYLQRVGSPTGDVNLYVYDNNATPTPDEPNASVASATTSVTASSLSASGQVVRLDMDRVSLTAGGSYWVVVEHIDSSGTDYVQIRVDESSPNGSDMTDTATSPEIVSWTVTSASTRQAAGFYVRRFGTQVVPTRQLAPAADKSAKFTWQSDGTVALASITSGGGGGASTLAGLTDTTITTPGAGDFLRYNGSTWLNTTLVAGDIPSLDAAKITTGTFADALIAASNVTQHVGAIDHDSLLNFVANEHVDHSAVAITGSSGLTGGGDLTASRSITVKYTSGSNLIDSAADNGDIVAADYILYQDLDTGDVRKDTVGALPFTNNTGDVESVANATNGGLTATDSGGPDVTLALAVDNLLDHSGTLAAADRFAVWESGAGTRKIAASSIGLNLFNNNLSLDASDIAAGTFATVGGTYVFAGSATVQLGSNTTQPTLQFWDRDTVGGAYRDVITVPDVEELDIGSAGWAVDILGSSVLVNGAAIGTVTSVSNATNGGITVANGTTTPTLAVDASDLPNFTASTSMEATDRFVVHEAGQASPSARQIAPIDIPLSIFNNNLGVGQNVQGAGIALSTTTVTNDTIAIDYQTTSNVISDANNFAGLSVDAANDRILIDDVSAAGTGVDPRVGYINVNDLPFAASTHTHPASDITAGTFGAGDYTFSGDLTIQGQLKSTGTGPHSIGVNVVGFERLRIGGNFTSDGSNTRASLMRVQNTLTGASGDTTRLTAFEVVPTVVTQSVAETIADVATAFFNEPGITLGTGSTVTNASTVKINNAPSEGTNNYALWVANGLSKFSGGLQASNVLYVDAGLSLQNETSATDPTAAISGYQTLYSFNNGSTFELRSIVGADVVRNIPLITGSAGNDQLLVSTGTDHEAEWSGSNLTWSGSILAIQNATIAHTGTGGFTGDGSGLTDVSADNLTLNATVASNTYYPAWVPSTSGTGVNTYGDNVLSVVIGSPDVVTVAGQLIIDDATGGTMLRMVDSGATNDTDLSVRVSFRNSSAEKGYVGYDSTVDTNLVLSNTIAGGHAVVETTTSTGYAILRANNNTRLVAQDTHVYVSGVPFQLGLSTGTTLQAGDLLANDGVLATSDFGATNIDHIWHDDTNNEWNFVSDGARKAQGNSSLRAARIHIGEPKIGYFGNRIGGTRTSDGSSTSFAHLALGGTAGGAVGDTSWLTVFGSGAGAGTGGTIYTQEDTEDVIGIVSTARLGAPTITNNLYDVTLGEAISTTSNGTVNTTLAHGWSTGQKVYITGHSDSNYNGWWTITVVDTDTFTLDGWSGTASGTGGNVYEAGRITRAATLVVVDEPTAGSATGIDEAWGIYAPVSAKFGAVTASALELTGAMSATTFYATTNGTESAPAYRFLSDPDTGMYRAGADQLVVTTGGTGRFLVGNGSVQSYESFQVIRPTGNSVMTRFRREDNTDLAWDQRIANPSGIFEIRSVTDSGTTVVNALQLSHADGNLTLKSWIRSEDGSVSAPTYSFTNDPDTGIWLNGTGRLSFSVGGSERVYINSGAMYTDALQDTTTRFGQSSHSLVALDAAADFAKPSGYRTMASNASLEMPQGNGTAWATYYHWQVMSRRNSGGGYYGLALAYNGGRMWYGQNSVNTALPNWYEIWTEATPQALPTADGSVSAPFYSFNSDPDTGMYYTSSTLNWTIGGTRQMYLDAGGLVIEDPTAAILRFFENDADPDEGNYRIVASGGDLYFQAVNDAGSVFSTGLRLNNNGSGGISSIYCYATFRPDSDASASLGANTVRWNTLYVDTAVLTNDLSVDHGGTGASSFGATEVILGGGGSNPLNSDSNLTFSGGASGQLNAPFFSGNGSLLTDVVSDSSTVTDLTTQTATYYPMMADGTSGSVSHFVDASELSYTSSTDTLNVVSLAASSDVTAGQISVNATGGTNDATLHVESSGIDVAFFASSTNNVHSWIGFTGNGSHENYFTHQTGGSGKTVFRHQNNAGGSYTEVGRFEDAALLMVDGSSSAPSYSFLDDTDTGMYLSSTGVLGFSTAGALRGIVSGTSTEFYTAASGYGFVARHASGTNNPGIFIENNEAGNYSRLVQSSTPGSGTLYLGIDGNNWQTINSTGQILAAYNGANATPTYSFGNDTDTGMRLSSTGILRLSAGTDAAYLDVDAANGRIITGSPLRLLNSFGGDQLRLTDTGGAGSLANPHLTFYDSTSTRLAYIGFGDTTTTNLYINNDTAGAHTYVSFASSATSGDLYLYNTGTTDTPVMYIANADGIKGYVQATDTGTVTLATNVANAPINIRDNGSSFNIATFDYAATDTVTFNSNTNAVLALNTASATGQPLIRFKQNTTDRARVQYINGGQLRFRLEGNTDDFTFYAGGATTATDLRLHFNGLGDDLGRWGVANSQFYVEEDQTVLTVAATVTCDWDRSNQLHLTITNTVTTIAIDDDSMQPGGSYILMVQEGTSAPSSVTWSSTDTIFWANGTAPVLNGGDLNDITVVQFFKTTAGSNTRIIGSWFLAQ